MVCNLFHYQKLEQTSYKLNAIKIKANLCQQPITIYVYSGKILSLSLSLSYTHKWNMLYHVFPRTDLIQIILLSIQLQIKHIRFYVGILIWKRWLNGWNRDGMLEWKAIRSILWYVVTCVIYQRKLWNPSEEIIILWLY